MRKGWFDAAALLLLFLALLPFNGPLLLGRLPFDADNTLFTIPFFSLFRERPFPLWNPYQFCGMPLIGNLQYQMFYPLRLPFLFWDSTKVYGFYGFAHYLIAAWGSYWLGRTLGLARSACVFGALTFACGGFIQGRISNPILFASAVWFPSVLAATVSLLRHPSARGAAILALVLAMLGTAGSPHGLFFAAVMIGLAWHWWSFVAVDEVKLPPKRGLLWLSGAGFLAALLFCPTWYHALELLPHTVRSQASFAEVTADPLLPREILLLWLGGISTPEYLDKTSYSGIVPVALFLLVVVHAISDYHLKDLLRGPVGFSLVLLVVGIFIALGARGGVYHLIYAIPGFKFLIGPTRALILFNLGWSIIAAVSFHRIMENAAWLNKRTAEIVLVALLLFGAAILARPLWKYGEGVRYWFIHPAYAPPVLTRWVMASWLVPLAAGIGVISMLIPGRSLLLAAVIFMTQFGALASFNQRIIIHYEKPDYFSTPSTVHFLKKQPEVQPWRALSWEPSRMYMMDVNDARGPSFLMPKLPDYFRVREVQGYDPMMLREYVEFMTALAGRNGVDDPYRTAHVTDPTSLFTDLAGAKYVIGYPWERNISRNPSARGIDVLPTTVTAVGLTSLAHGATGAAEGTELGAITLIGTDGKSHRLPVRAGIHTAELRAINRDLPIRHRPIESNLRWHAFDAGLQRELQYSNYYSRIHLPEPLEIQRVEWAGSQPNSVFVVPNLTIESRPPPELEKRFRAVFEAGSIAVHENSTAFPRAYLASQVAVAETANAAAELLKQNSSLQTNFAVASSTPKLRVDPHSTGTVRFRKWDANSAVVEAVTTGSSLLVLSDSYYPGRRAWINGSEAPVLRVNGIFQGVSISSSGVHLVEFRYLPRSLVWTLCSAAIGVLITIALITGILRRNKPTASAFISGSPCIVKMQTVQ